jgi:hypothetical protein
MVITGKPGKSKKAMKRSKILLGCCVVCFGISCKPVKHYISENKQAKLYLYDDTLAVDIRMDSVVYRNYFIQDENVNEFLSLKPYFKHSNSRFVAQYTLDHGDVPFGLMSLSVSALNYFDDETSKYFVIINSDTIEPFNGGYPFSSLPENKEGSITLYDSYLGYVERADSLKNTMGSFLYLDKFKHEYQVCPHTLLLDSIQVLQMKPYPVLLMQGQKFELSQLEEMTKRKFIKTFFVHAQKKNQKMLKQINQFHHLIED